MRRRLRPAVVPLHRHSLAQLLVDGALVAGGIVLSAGPATHAIGEFAIDLARPRDVADIRMMPRFVELHSSIWHTMKAEVLKGYAQSRH